MTSGGKREGAGRPKSEPTKTVSFRINAKVLDKAKKMFGKDLNKKIGDYLKRIISRS